jgi:hypothetical protein
MFYLNGFSEMRITGYILPAEEYWVDTPTRSLYVPSEWILTGLILPPEVYMFYLNGYSQLRSAGWILPAEEYWVDTPT